MKLKCSISGYRAKKILENAERKLLNERVRQVNYYKIGVLKCNPDELAARLSGMLSSDFLQRVLEFVKNIQLSQHSLVKNRQMRNFDKLKLRSRADLDKDWRQTKKLLTGPETAKWVKILSDRPLSDPEISVLAKGNNFAVTPKKLPVADFITATESAICKSNFNEAKAELLRSKVCDTLCKNKPRIMNLNKEEREALDGLIKDRNVVIVPADKGSCLVVLNREDYDQKCKSLLDDTKTYKPLGYNLTNGFRKKVCAYLHQHDLHQRNH